MIRIHIVAIISLIGIGISSCDTQTKVNLRTPTKSERISSNRTLDKATYYDKVLGALVGSAIGDAMGASTEMWQRADIQAEFGYITGLTAVTREKSAEGIWTHNLDSGATTDDTRWKYFLTKYYLQFSNDLSADNFSKFIVNYYQTEAKGLSDQTVLNNPDLLDEKMQKVDWIKEWARVALAHEKGSQNYIQAINRFYGGEMSCAGMLYSPMFGLINDTPEKAYVMAYEHSMFDIGYAKDITSLVAAITQLAMHNKEIDEILKESLTIDPYKYLDSRLIERQSSSIAKDSRIILLSSNNLKNIDSTNILPPRNFTGSNDDWMRHQFVFKELEKRQKAIAFHAGEIWQILYMSLIFGKGDFQRTIEFIVNYGRDNDTVAAIAGMILGAKDGFQHLPDDLKTTVLKVSRERMGIDLEELARELTDQYFLAL